VLLLQVQPVPVIEASVNPPGSVSLTITVAVVAPVPLFITVTVYAPVCPCVKFPLCADATVRDGGRIVVESMPVSVADPPPDTLTEFTCGELALAPTFTVTVMVG
jgi:hypothetical protein